MAYLKIRLVNYVCIAYLAMVSPMLYGMHTDLEQQFKSYIQDMQLIDAAKCNDVEKMNSLLAGGINVNSRDLPDGTSALMYAAFKNSIEAAQALIKAGADINYKNKDGWGALMCAAVNDFTDMALLLIKAGADVNAVDNEGNTTLMGAAYTGQAKTVTCLMAAGADPAQANNKGDTALLGAARWGHENVIAHLIPLVEDDLAKSVKALPPLRVDELLEWAMHLHTVGAQVAVTLSGMDMKTGGTKMSFKIEHGHKAHIAYSMTMRAALTKHLQNYPPSPVHFGHHVFKAASLPFPHAQLKRDNSQAYVQALQEVHAGIQVIKEFAAQYTFVDLVDSHSNTPLHCAIIAKNRPMLMVLLSLMAQHKRCNSLFVFNKAGNTPIHSAIGMSISIRDLFYTMLVRAQTKN